MGGSQANIPELCRVDVYQRPGEGSLFSVEAA